MTHPTTPDDEDDALINRAVALSSENVKWQLAKRLARAERALAELATYFKPGNQIQFYPALVEIAAAVIARDVAQREETP